MHYIRNRHKLSFANTSLIVLHVDHRNIEGSGMQVLIVNELMEELDNFKLNGLLNNLPRVIENLNIDRCNPLLNIFQLESVNKNGAIVFSFIEEVCHVEIVARRVKLVRKYQIQVIARIEKSCCELGHLELDLFYFSLCEVYRLEQLVTMVDKFVNFSTLLSYLEVQDVLDFDCKIFF